MLASLIHCTPLRHMLGQYRDWQALGRDPGGVGNWGASELAINLLSPNSQPPKHRKVSTFHQVGKEISKLKREAAQELLALSFLASVGITLR